MKQCEQMNKVRVCDALSKTALFEGLERSTFQNYCGLTRVKKYKKGEIVCSEGELCMNIGVIQKGQIAMQKYTSEGDFATIALLKPGDYFGDDLVFGSINTYHFTFEAMEPSEVLYVGKDTLNALFDHSSVVKNNFLRLLSDRVNKQNKRIALLSQKSIRHKIAFYLLDLRFELEVKGHKSNVIRLPLSKEVIAKLLAMPRPSFSRELINMQNQGLIKVCGRDIELLDISRLESEVVEGYNYEK